MTTLDGYVASELYLARARGLRQAAQGARRNLEAAKAAEGQRPRPGRRPWWHTHGHRGGTFDDLCAYGVDLIG